jgi:hypothetical protein
MSEMDHTEHEVGPALVRTGRYERNLFEKNKKSLFD